MPPAAARWGGERWGGERSVVARVVVAATTLVAVLTGCATTSAGPGVSPAPSPSTAWQQAARPASLDAVSVSADLYRSRIDPARGGIQLSVRNEGDAPLALAAARLHSPLLAAPLERVDEVLIPPGAQRDLPMILASPVCPTDLAEAASAALPEAVLVVPLADGSSAELRVPTTDRLGQWAEWFEATCFSAAVDAAVELTVRAPSASATDGTIELELVARPRPGRSDGKSPDVRLVSIAGTVLLGALGADGEPVESIPLEATIGTQNGDGPLVAPLRFRANRCDAHAIADDKQGTLFRVSVSLGDRAGTVTVVADPPTKDRIYANVTSACAAG